MSEEEETSVRGSIIGRMYYSPAASLMSLAESTVDGITVNVYSRGGGECRTHPQREQR